MVFTKIEIQTGTIDLKQVIAHPSLALAGFNGRQALLQKIITISFKQLPNMAPTCLMDIKIMCGKTLIGHLSGVSQESLYYIVRMTSPEIVVEAGVYRRIGSAFILKGLKDNGHGDLYSIDLPNGSYVRENGEVDNSPLGKNYVIILRYPR